MNPIAREGRFRGKIVAHEYVESKTSMSMGIGLVCHLTEYQADDGTWKPMDGDPQSAEGTFWIINKQGRQLITTEEAFCIATGWDGDADKISGAVPWEPNLIEFDVKEETYTKQDGTVRVSFRMAFLEPIGGKKLGAQPCSKSKLDRIKAKMAAARAAALLPPEPLPPPASQESPF
jgi:hypothetical protein